MKRKTIVSLIAIVVIGAAVIFAGCIGSTTTIYDIKQNPDNYVGKEVTIDARSSCIRPIYGGAAPPYKGFWISDMEAHGGEYNVIEAAIFVKYDGDAPISKECTWMDAKTVRVRGIVTEMGDGGILYIDGKSWEDVD